MFVKNNKIHCIGNSNIRELSQIKKKTVESEYDVLIIYDVRYNCNYTMIKIGLITYYKRNLLINNINDLSTIHNVCKMH